jgi:hypothetical protein
MMTSKKKAFRREDRPGHLDPEHAARLRALSAEEHRGSSSDASPRVRFDADGDGGLPSELAEASVLNATSGGDALGDALEAEVEEDRGGPFVASSDAHEMASGTDASNPEDAEREPFPIT